MSIRTEIVAVDVVRPLQRAVLRPHLPPEAATYAEDLEPSTVHLAAYDAEGQVAGVATFFPQPYPGPFVESGPAPDVAATAWRLRGMATDPARRGEGFGAAVLRRGMAEAATRGGRLLWCNARTLAVPFYVAHGLRTIGAEFEVAGIGSHYRMVAPLRAP
jgi:GNAT superfamily N-acetyltransferase